jgi:hypothetical protein
MHIHLYIYINLYSNNTCIDGTSVRGSPGTDLPAENSDSPGGANWGLYSRGRGYPDDEVCKCVYGCI